MFRTKTFNEPCKVSGQMQLVTVYFQDAAVNGTLSLSNSKRHHFICDNQDCPAKLDSHICPFFNSANP